VLLGDIGRVLNGSEVIPQDRQGSLIKPWDKFLKLK